MIDEKLIKGYEVGDWIVKYDPAISSVQKKLKFEQGDWVVPIDNDGMSKKFKKAKYFLPSNVYGECGEVIGKYSGSAGPHYAVRFSVLKKVYPIYIVFLRKATEEEALRTRLKKVEDRLPELKGMF